MFSIMTGHDNSPILIFIPFGWRWESSSLTDDDDDKVPIVYLMAVLYFPEFRNMLQAWCKAHNEVAS